ncbi:hypothetical protein XA68_13072 [Ophiocordyceps unilateralis]|uniref:RGS domain-containing protein n=1 Tax=Ophiocordyceps unilateralis TaxID=268505 RepID=A0A2A9PD99_OPHUN|nr:hypothetical protein XA68_13072 [Ophiocordyceps unilateralis]
MGSEVGVTPDSRKEFIMTPVTKWWISWAVIWTVFVTAGISYLICRRDSPVLRIRGLSLSIASVILLHLYFISVQGANVWGPLVPGDAEFWVMGTYLPFGIALLHASNSRFLHVARMQKKYMERRQSLPPDKPAHVHHKGGIIGRFRRLDYTSKILITVGSGIILQFLLTVIMYLVSRKYHSSWGIPGTEVHGTEMQQKAEMGRGWEWWPSVIWQFFWAWVVAPIVLWKARGVHDTQGWRFQTIACAVSSLHATPMWLIALYVPAMEPVNKYWLPPQWLCLSIIFIEIFTIFLPCWQVMRHQTLQQETLESIALWESKNVKASFSGSRSVHTGSTVVESMMSGWKSTNGSVKTNDSGESILTMSALEHVLERNPGPLQEFSALRDFSGENIAFLTSVADWKNSLPPAVRDGGNSGARDDQTTELLHERFNRALRIYAGYVGVRDAEFPINISSQDLKRLETVFEMPCRSLFGQKTDVDAATPFDMPGQFTPSPSGSMEKTSEVPSTSVKGFIADRAQYWGPIPEGFDEKVFDDAEKSIKYLVLTNTWPKFVKARRSSIDASDNLEAGHEVIHMVRNRHVE